MPLFIRLVESISSCGQEQEGCRLIRAESGFCSPRTDRPARKATARSPAPWPRGTLDRYQATRADARDGRQSLRGATKRILQADEAILDAAFTAHTVRHGCGESSQCEARRVLKVARESLRRMLSAKTLEGGLGRDYESIALGYTDG